MRLKTGIVLGLILLSSGFSGCVTARPEASVRPLDGDFFFVKSGEVISIVKNGAFCSDEYLSEILLIKAQEAKK